MRDGPIGKFGTIASELNSGNRLVVDCNGVKGDVNIQAALYLGVRGGYKKPIYPARLVSPLLEIAGGLRMEIYLVKPEKNGGIYHLACVLIKDGLSGDGFCRLPIKGMVHDREEGIKIIREAAKGAKVNYYQTVALAEGRTIPVSIEPSPDPLRASIEMG